MLPPPVRIESRDNASYRVEPSAEYDIAVMCKDALDDFFTADEKELSALIKALIGGIFFLRFIRKPEHGWKSRLGEIVESIRKTFADRGWNLSKKRGRNHDGLTGPNKEDVQLLVNTWTQWARLY